MAMVGNMGRSSCGGWCASADSALSIIVLFVALFDLMTQVGVHGGIFGGRVFQIAWNTTYALYEFFVVFLFLGLGVGLILDPTRCRFAFVTGVVVVFRVFLLLFFLVSAFLVSSSGIPGVLLRMVGYRCSS